MVFVEGAAVVGRRFVQPAYVAAVIRAPGTAGRSSCLQDARQEQVFLQGEVVGTEAGTDAQVFNRLYFREHVANQAAVAGFKEGLDGGGYRIFYRRKTVKSVGAISIVNRRLGAEQNGGAEYAINVVVVVDAVSHRAAHRQVRSHFYPVRDIVVDIQTAAAALEARTFDDTVLVEEGARK